MNLTIIKHLNSLNQSQWIHEEADSKATYLDMPLYELFELNIEDYKDIRIEKLELTKRSTNMLMRSNVDTFGKLLSMSSKDIMYIRNMGLTSFKDILGRITGIADSSFIIGKDKTISVEENSNYYFVNAEGSMCEDIDLYTIPMSVRTCNILKRNDIHYLSQLLKYSDEELATLHSAGEKTVKELIEIRDNAAVRHMFVLPILADDELQESKTVAVSLYGFISNPSDEIDRMVENAYILKKNNNSALAVELYRDTRVISAIVEMVFSECGEWGYALRQNVYDSLPIVLRDAEQFELLLSKPNIHGAFECDGEIINVFHESVYDVIKSCFDDRDVEIIMSKINGDTLEEIGYRYNLSRERIRQIIEKRVRKLKLSKKRFLEDRFSDVFTNYNLETDAFEYIFGVDEKCQNYLAICYDHGTKTVEDLLKDDSISTYYKNKVDSYLEKKKEGTVDYKREFIHSFLKQYCQDTITFDEFVKIYKAAVEKLPEEAKRRMRINNVQSFMNHLSDRNDVVWTLNKKLRYYEITRDLFSLTRRLILERYNNLEISTRKLFRDNPELMEEFDIRDEYELHNIMKKLLGKDNRYDIDFSRTPILKFGTVNRDEQITNLLMRCGNISANDFAKAYEEEYGMLSATVLGTSVACIKKYYHDGMYRLDYEKMPSSELLEFKNMLTSDFYTVSELKSIFIRNFPDLSIDMVNPYNLQLMGFIVNVDYVISGKYGGAKDFFKTFLSSKDVLMLSDIPSNYKSVGIFNNVFAELRQKGQIIEVKSGCYYSIAKLDECGFSKKDCKEYAREVANCVEPGTYFTSKSIGIKKWKKEKFDEYDIDEDILKASLIYAYVPGITMTEYGHTKVFFVGSEHKTNVEFITNIIMSQPKFKISLEELMRLLKEKYGIIVSTTKLLEKLAMSAFEYNSVSGQISLADIFK